MTVATIQDAPAYEEEESFYLPQMCDGKHWVGVQCLSPAKYRCMVTCECHNIIWWCENCLFEFLNWSAELAPENIFGHCFFCQRQVRVSPELIKVIGRIK